MTDRIESPPSGEIQGLVERAMALANAATVGPWKIGPSHNDEYIGPPGETAITAPNGTIPAVAIPTGGRGDRLPELTRANAAFIAASRQLIPELCEAITRLSQPSGEEIRMECVRIVEREAAHHEEAAADIIRESCDDDNDEAWMHSCEARSMHSVADLLRVVPLSSGGNKSDDGKKGQAG